jgi:hypothetical protein
LVPTANCAAGSSVMQQWRVMRARSSGDTGVGRYGPSSVYEAVWTGAGRNCTCGKSRQWEDG